MVVTVVGAYDGWTLTVQALEQVAWVLARVVGVALVFLIPLWFYRIVTLPLRRRERASLFLDILKLAIERGRSVERAVVSVAATEPPRPTTRFGVVGKLLWVWPYRLLLHCLGLRRWVLGPGIHGLAGRLEGGQPLGDALRVSDGLLPPNAIAMLRVGDEVGDIARVLPACCRALGEGTSKLQSAMNYLVLFGTGFILCGSAVAGLFATLLLPRLEEMAIDIGGSGLGSPMASVLRVFELGRSTAVWGAFLGLLVFQVLCAILYAGGPRLVAALHLRGIGDRLATWLPWRRKQLQRDFCAMLATLLDAGVPDDRAVELAGRATANRLFERRAAAAVAAIRHGEPLTEAVARLDAAGEFRWRLANAAHRRSGFLDALAGWLRSLDAKAYQQEQVAGQAITTAVVLCNGAMVALFAFGLFYFLVTLVEVQGFQ